MADRPTMVRPQRCRSCPAMVWWLENESTGRRAPIEVEPPEDGRGNCVVDLELGTYVVLNPARRAFAAPRTTLFRNHFQTCPAAAQWRRTNVQPRVGQRAQG